MDYRNFPSFYPKDDYFSHSDWIFNSVCEEQEISSVESRLHTPTEREERNSWTIFKHSVPGFGVYGPLRIISQEPQWEREAVDTPFLEVLKTRLKPWWRTSEKATLETKQLCNLYCNQVFNHHIASCLDLLGKEHCQYLVLQAHPKGKVFLISKKLKTNTTFGFLSSPLGRAMLAAL